MAASTKPKLSLRHLAGCPAERTETYELPTPAGNVASVTRCIDCGAQVTDGGVERADPEPAEAA